MDSLPINPTDLGVALFLLIAALLGLALGFVRGGLFVFSWLGAALATLYAFPLARPYGRQWIEAPWLADLAAGAAVFVIMLALLTVLSSLISGWVRSSALNSLDRSLGMLAGLATAVLILFAATGAMERMWRPEQRPGWLQQAKVMPLLHSGSEWLLGLIPEDAAESSVRAARQAEERARKALETERALRDMLQPSTDTPSPQGTTEGGYDKQQRQELDRLIEGNQ